MRCRRRNRNCADAQLAAMSPHVKHTHGNNKRMHAIRILLSTESAQSSRGSSQSATSTSTNLFSSRLCVGGAAVVFSRLAWSSSFTVEGSGEKRTAFEVESKPAWGATRSHESHYSD